MNQNLRQNCFKFLQNVFISFILDVRIGTGGLHNKALDESKELEEIKSRIDLLRDEKQILEQDIDRLKNEKIEEMSSLLSLKGVKEKFQKALDEIKLEVENMKNNLESLKKQHHPHI